LDVFGGRSLILYVESLYFLRWLIDLILLEVLKETKDRLSQKLIGVKEALMRA
jgi:hypothetical protein